MARHFPKLPGNLALLAISLTISVQSLAGCSYLPTWVPGSTKVMNPEEYLAGYAETCYRNGLRYLYENRYELAREQFALAASAARTGELEQAAVSGKELADRMITQKQ